MDFKIPRNSLSELIIYLWKIIDIPEISINDLLFKISFELFLFPPEQASKFIKNSIKSQLLKKNANEYISLSKNINKQFLIWQKSRRDDISVKLNELRKTKSAKRSTEVDYRSNFNVIIKAFSEKGTSNRAATVPNAALNIIEFDVKKGKIYSEVKGSKEESYFIEISSKEKTLRHNCHDFLTRRAEDKKFCKHLIKLFLLLNERNKEATLCFLKSISENINDWDFLG